MKTNIQIIKKALILILLSDRVQLENSIQWGKKSPLKKREEHRKYLIDICEKRECNDLLTLKETQILFTEVGDLKEVEVNNQLFQYESVQVLCWSLGLFEYPLFDNGFCIFDFHPMVNEKNILNPPKLQNLQQLRLFDEVSMLWHWRAIEGRKNKSIYKTNLKNRLEEIFNCSFADAFEYIPFSKGINVDFLVNNLTYNEISKQLNGIMEIKTKWIFHAIEWILNDDDWDKIELNT